MSNVGLSRLVNGPRLTLARRARGQGPGAVLEFNLQDAARETRERNFNRRFREQNQVRAAQVDFDLLRESGAIQLKWDQKSQRRDDWINYVFRIVQMIKATNGYEYNSDWKETGKFIADVVR